MPKKIVISKIGGPEVLKYVDYNLTDSIGEEEIRIKHTAIGLNYIDTYHRSGIYPLPTDLPICPGLEASGKIIRLGSKVKNFKVGDRVCYATIPLGAYCEIRDFPASKVIKIPDEISENSAASILLQGMTVEYLFERLYKIKKNENILFHAAAGGVGLLACQWARSIGCNLIGTVGSDEKAELAKLNGCTYVINYKTENVTEKVNKITNGKGVSVVYDGVGKDTFKISLDCLSLRGLFVSFGQSSGMVPEVNLHKTFNPKSLFYTRPTLMHYNLTRKELEKSSNLLFQKIINKEIKEHIYKIIELKNASEAHKLIQSRETYGSIILKP
jgi:NADPH2:quinone reductase